VNGLNLPAFLGFAGGMAEELMPDPVRIADWCLAALAEKGAQGPSCQTGGLSASGLV
jgi:hypothetical protein